jgi:hypothetical protein
MSRVLLPLADDEPDGPDDVDPIAPVVPLAPLLVAGQQHGAGSPEEQQRAYAELLARGRAARIEARVEQLDVDADARRIIALRDRLRRPAIVDGLIDSCDVDEVPPPRWLMAPFLPQAAVGFLGAPWGAYKSFTAVSWACSLAAGRPWLDRPEFTVSAPVRVLYVAAEGAHGIAQRVSAWRRLNGDLPRGALTIYPRPVRLNDDGDVDELLVVARDLGVGLVVIDTLHRSMPGAEENSATEVGLAFEAAARLRDELGTTVLLVDHAGHDARRLRGSSAKASDADFVLMVELSGDDRATAQRTLTVSKMKDAPTDGRWPLRLRAVPDHPAPVVEIGEGGRPLADGFGEHPWWSDEIPDELLDRLRGDGRRVAVLIVGALRHLDSPDGLTRAELHGLIRGVPGVTVGKSTWHAGFGLASRAGAIEPSVTSAARFVLGSGWDR